MFVTLAVVLCHLHLGETACFEEIVTDSGMTPSLTFSGCLTGSQAPLAKWKSEHTVYRDPRYTIDRYKCVPGHYKPAVPA